jgi:hypothetical protein
MAKILWAAALILAAIICHAQEGIVKKGSTIRFESEAYCQPVHIEVRQRFDLDSLKAVVAIGKGRVSIYQTMYDSTSSVLDSCNRTIRGMDLLYRTKESIYQDQIKELTTTIQGLEKTNNRQSTIIKVMGIASLVFLGILVAK